MRGVEVSEQELGFIAYEAAREATGCSQGWGMANQKKWIAAAKAVQQHERQRVIEVINNKKVPLGYGIYEKHAYEAAKHDLCAAVEGME